MKGRSALALCVAAVLGVVVAACGSSGSSSTGKVSGTSLTVYSSLPLQGGLSDVSQATVNGAKMALAAAGGKVGKYTITYKPLDDSTAAAGSWDPGQTTNNAHTACDNSNTIGYLGEFNSGASAISIPILNRCGIPQISPSNTAVGLTSNGNGAAPGEPQKYYPTGKRTYARVVPYDTVQAAAQAALQKSQGCTKTYVLDDNEVDGEDRATSFALAAQSSGLRVLGTQQFDPHATDFTALAQTIATSGANCVLVSAISGSNAVPVTRAIAAALPHAQLFAPAGVAQSTYVSPAEGGIPLSDDARVLITSPVLGGGAYPPAARAFLQAFTSRYGPPEPDAILGYEAMRLMLAAIRTATHNGQQPARRSAVVRAIFDTRNRHSVLGTYSIQPDGNTTMPLYGVWKAVNGTLRFWKAFHG